MVNNNDNNNHDNNHNNNHNNDNNNNNNNGTWVILMHRLPRHRLMQLPHRHSMQLHYLM